MKTIIKGIKKHNTKAIVETKGRITLKEHHYRTYSDKIIDEMDFYINTNEDKVGGNSLFMWDIIPVNHLGKIYNVDVLKVEKESDVKTIWVDIFVEEEADTYRTEMISQLFDQQVEEKFLDFINDCKKNGPAQERILKLVESEKHSKQEIIDIVKSEFTIYGDSKEFCGEL